MSRALPILLLLPSLCALAQQTHIGKAVRIANGDNLSILVDGQTRKIRLAEINTQERRQPFGTKSKQALADLTFNKNVRVVEVDVDCYDRSVGRAYVNGLDVNAELVKQGYAWVYRKYAKSPELYSLEDEARNAKRGLWANQGNIPPPWEWGKGKRTAQGGTETGEGEIIGNKRSKVYHLPGCPSYSQVSEKNRLFFKSPEVAIEGFLVDR